MKNSLDIHLPSGKLVVRLLSVPIILLFLLASDQLIPADYIKPILQKRKELGRGNVSQLVNEQRWNIIVTAGALVNEAFSGYDLSKAVSSADTQMTGNDPAEEHIGEATPEHKIDYDISKPIEQAEASLRSALSQSRPVAGKPAWPLENPAHQFEIVSIIAKRAAEAGIPEVERKELVQSYVELSRILPQREAQKLIMLKISNKNKQ